MTDDRPITGAEMDELLASMEETRRNRMHTRDMLREMQKMQAMQKRETDEELTSLRRAMILETQAMLKRMKKREMDEEPSASLEEMCAMIRETQDMLKRMKKRDRDRVFAEAQNWRHLEGEYRYHRAGRKPGKRYMNGAKLYALRKPGEKMEDFLRRIVISYSTLKVIGRTNLAGQPTFDALKARGFDTDDLERP
jgi:hypothetical protein